MYKQEPSGGKMRKRGSVLLGVACAVIAVVLIAVSSARALGSDKVKRVLNFVSGHGEFTVDTDIKLDDITDFYYTLSSSAYPPTYQRYRFYVQDGKHVFYHEKREGKQWPLTEACITVSGTLDLSEAEWAEFYQCLRGGKVKPRAECIESGNSGPWLFLYWKGDKSKYQQFSFADSTAEKSFAQLCARLRQRAN